MKPQFDLVGIDRVIYIWARYEGTRDGSDAGKHYSKSDLEELIRRLNKYKDNPHSFNEGFEKEEDDTLDEEGVKHG